MKPQSADELTVREFLRAIHEQAAHAFTGIAQPGYLQLSRLHPNSKTLVPYQFEIGDVDRMVKTALTDAAAGHNVYIEGRTVLGVTGKNRGGLENTRGVFAFIVDSDGDKGKAGNLNGVQPSMIIETSPGNTQPWLFLDQAMAANEAQELGAIIRKFTGSDQDTGVVTQPCRVAGTPNYPSPEKQKRGRTSVEPTRILEYSGKVWTAEDLRREFSVSAAAAGAQSGAKDETDLAKLLERCGAELRALLRTQAATDEDRSQTAFIVLKRLIRRGFTDVEIKILIEAHPQGVGARYQQGKDLGADIKRVRAKVGAKPEIIIAAGQLPRIVGEVEEVLLDRAQDLYQRGGLIVRPVLSKVRAADDRDTLAWRLIPVRSTYLVDLATRLIDFRKYDSRTKTYKPIDCPNRVAETYLAREGEWRLPLLFGVTNTPFLRADGSICEQLGYDAASGLLFQDDGQSFPAIPQNPSKDDAIEALAYVDKLLDGFPFVAAADRSVALSGILTVLDRRSMATAPMHSFTAPEAGSGKSLLTDIASMFATGQLAPVIAQGRNEEELEKRLGTALIHGDQLISIDNCEHTLHGVFLCQALTQQRLNIRVLGQSRHVEVPVNVAIFANGNNLVIAGDLVRRSLLGTIDARCERPELRNFDIDVIEAIKSDRGRLVAAALTVLRAWHVSQVKPQAKPIGSFEEWSFRIREPLLWLGRADPCDTIAKIRETDPARTLLATVHAQWKEHLGCEKSYTIQEIMNEAVTITAFQAALRGVAVNRKGQLDNASFGRWLIRVKGKVINNTMIDYQGITDGYPYWKLMQTKPARSSNRPRWA